MKKNLKVYISGPMTGVPKKNYPAFARTARMLRKKGYTVVSPAEFKEKRAYYWNWSNCLKRDIIALVRCDAIYLLPGWETSEGAALELMIAKKLGLVEFKKLKSGMLNY